MCRPQPSIGAVIPDALAQRPSAGDALAELDHRHAPAEAELIRAYREHCPNLARIDLIDTVRLDANLTASRRQLEEFKKQ